MPLSIPKVRAETSSSRSIFAGGAAASSPPAWIGEFPEPRGRSEGVGEPPRRSRFTAPPVHDLKARDRLTGWIPYRAYNNGVYIVFGNPFGVDHDRIRNGTAMIVDPYGDFIAECNTIGDDMVVGLCKPVEAPAENG